MLIHLNGLQKLLHERIGQVRSRPKPTTHYISWKPKACTRRQAIHASLMVDCEVGINKQPPMASRSAAINRCVQSLHPCLDLQGHIHNYTRENIDGHLFENGALHPGGFFEIDLGANQHVDISLIGQGRGIYMESPRFEILCDGRVFAAFEIRAGEIVNTTHVTTAGSLPVATQMLRCEHGI